MIPTRTMARQGDSIGFRPLTENETAIAVSEWLGGQLASAYIFEQSPDEAIRREALEVIQFFGNLLDALNRGEPLTFNGGFAQTLFGSTETRVVRKTLAQPLIHIIEPESPASN